MSRPVLVAGEIFIDLIMGGFPFYPLPGQESFATHFRREIGGGAAITACGLGSLGSPAALLSVAGSDHHAFIAGRLAQFSVDPSALALHRTEPTGFTVAVTTPEDRAFFTYPGANRAFPGLILSATFENFRHVHLAWAPPFDTGAELFQCIHDAGATISLDTGWHPDWLSDPRALPLLAAVDIVFPNESEAACLTGETEPDRILRRFAEANLPGVALKLGAAGARLLLNGQTYAAAPRPVTPVDTTGAGDCFDAGFLHCWLAGDSPERCLAAGNLCGALSTQAYGGIDGFPSREIFLEEMTHE